MNSLKSFLLSAVLVCASTLLVMAQNTASRQNAIMLNTALLKATGAYEDAVKPSLAGNSKAIADFLKIADKESADVIKALSPVASADFKSLLQRIHISADAKDGVAVARDSMAVFRLIVDNLKTDALKIPKEVSLLDYAGYQLEILTADKPDWAAIKKLAADSDGWWKTISKTQVTNKDLRAVMSSTIAGLKEAAAKEDLAMVKFAARIDLDLVDLLETHLSAEE